MIAPYLEDIGHEEANEVECHKCEVIDEQEGTHYLDSENFRWQCSHCGYVNDTPMSAEEPDPDYYHDNREMFD